MKCGSGPNRDRGSREEIKIQMEHIDMATERDVETLKDKVARGTRILFEMGLVDYHGHLSARIPGTRDLLIKPALVSLREVKAEDVVRVNFDEYAKQLPETERRLSGIQEAVREIQLPPRETIIHAAVMQARPDVHGVVHTHQLFATAFGAAGKEIRPVHITAAAFGKGTPILDKADLILSEEDGKEVAEALGDANALLLRNHGVVIVGGSVEEAVSNAVYLERAAQMHLIASLVGEARALPESFCELFAANMRRRAPHAFAYFESLGRERSK